MSAIPAGYKQTEVGVIPKDWKSRTIGDLCVAYSGGTPPTSILKYYGGDIPWITSSDLNQGYIESVNGRITQSGLENSSAKMVNAGSLLIALYGATAGVTAITRVSGAINQAVLAIIPKTDDTHFIYQYLRFKKDWVINTFTQGGQPNLSGDIVKSLPIPVPEVAEQRAIAAALSDVDTLLAKLEQLIVKKRDLKQAAMQQLLTGQTRLPGFGGAWEVQPIKSIVETPVTDGPHLTPRFLEVGVPFLSVNNLVNNKIDLSDLRFISKEDDIEFSKKCKPRKGDLLLGKAASVGKVAIVETDMDLNIWSPIAMIRIDKNNDPRFVYYQLQSADLTKQIVLLTNSSSQGNIGMGDIEKLLVQLPAYEEQTAIATVLADMDAELAALEARRDKTRALKQGMMQELLTGRIRLI